jgi:hypothetical protein
MSYILGAIFLYLLFRFVTGFVIPVYKTVSQVKRQVNAMRDFAGQPDNSHRQPFANKYQNANTGTEQPKFDIGGEYIPFEEVREK